ncbi:hypothetical protein [Bacillus sp. ISL-46]|uniref:hypothetical protein n=1 Tax=Bacillus sp. ISL-46 TaxID=2819129 RepID=UPI001BE9B845|nr:hypothetical protein [Bacillus sp. ISL-46]MBT2723043.1 hypothetical protein [Bacillus sp. ISL-46]
MTQSYFPFSNSPILNQAQWSKVAQHWLGTGVIKGLLNELQVYADSTGMQIKTKSGQVYLKGHFFESDAEEVLAISTADITNPRIDRVIVRVDWVTNNIQLAVLQGVPAASPAVPALTQNTSRWEISLAQVRVNANVSTITSGNITDERSYVKNANSEVAWTNLTLTGGTTAFQTRTPRYAKIGNQVVIEGEITAVPNNNITMATLPVGYRPPQLRIFKCAHNSGISNEGATIYVNTDGTIIIQAIANTNTSISLMGISFYLG